MEYLKAFVIGSSALAIFPLLSSISTDIRYDYSSEYSNKYPLMIPIYYGIMSILALYIGKKFKLSFYTRFLIVSIISIIIILLINHNYNDKYYIQSKQNNIFLIIQDIILQFIIFIVLLFLTINFSKYEALKIFIIGGSVFTYSINYLALNIQRLNYEPKYFVITEPFVQGLSLLIGLNIGMYCLKLSLIKSYILYNVISTIIMVLIAKYIKLYKELELPLQKYTLNLLISGFIKMPIYIYLINNLK